MGIDVKTHGDDLFSAAAYDAIPVRARSEAQERSSVLIAGRELSVGNVLASENAPFYVAILSALADFRAGHEFEPLFEDVRDAVLGDFANLMKVIEHVWLGGGEKARKLLGVRGAPTGVAAEVEIDRATLSFQDIALERSKS